MVHIGQILVGRRRGWLLLRQGLLSVQTLPQASGSHLDATHHDTVTCNIGYIGYFGYFWNDFGHIMLSKQWGVESLQNLLLKRTFIVLISKRQAGSLIEESSYSTLAWLAGSHNSLATWTN